jgi:hypothetical protein
MAEKRGRFEEIYRQKTQGGEGALSALKSTASERRKEQADLRRMFPKSGMVGAMLESAFGKSYKYNSGKGDKKSAEETKNQPSFDEKSTNAIRLNTSISAKNSMVLPGMARDMNIMRQNIVRMTKHTTGSAVSKADAHFMKSKEREASYESALGKSLPSKDNVSPKASSVAGGGLFKSMFGSIGGILGGGASMIGGVLSGLGSLAGGAVSGILKVLSGALGGFGLGGALLAILGGSLLVSMYKGLDFGKYGAQFGEIFSGMSKSLKSFFGIDDSQGDGKNIFEKVASYLDDTFKTTGFSDGLKYIIQKWKDFSSEISYQISKMYNDVMANATASFMAVGDIFVGIGKDVKAMFYKWLDDNTVGLYTVFGAAMGSFAGAKGAAYGAAAGALYGGGQLLANRRRDNAVKDLAEQEQILADMKAKGLTETPKDSRFPYQSIGAFENTIKDTRKIVEANKQEIEDRKGSSDLKPFSERFSQYKEEARKLYPEMQRPSRDRTSPDYSSTSPTAMTEKDANSEMANLIRKRFIEAGFTAEQAEAAVINAFAESTLDPKAESKITSKEDSVGLFQMNRKGGLGYNEKQNQAYTRAQLQDPNFNIDLAIQAAKKSKSFSKAKTMEEAIEAFVRDIERPANIEKQVADRVAMANRPLESAVVENTNATRDLTKQAEAEKEDTFTATLAALLQAMASTTTGTNITNVNNTSVTGGGMASPYNDDLLTLFKSRAAQGF